ncbi:MAG: peptidyl-prolyl cis-trans isomerase [Bdellovibrionales bacterium]
MRVFRKLIRPQVWGGFCLILFLSACPSQEPTVSGKIVLKVNDQTLSLRDFSNQLARRLKDLDALSAKSTQTVTLLKEELLRAFIARALILDYARTKNISVDSTELEKEVDKIRSSYPDDVTFRRTLAQENISFSEWREQLKFRLIEQKVFAAITAKVKPPTSEELKQYYDQNTAQFKTKERIFLRQIVVEEQGKADYLKSELKKRSLESLARSYSIAPEAKNGGLVGWIGKGEVDFFDPLFTAKIGAPSQIFKTPFGFHIAVVERKSPATTLSFEEVKSRIDRQIRSQKEQAIFTEWLDAQLRSSRVWRDYKLINSLSVDTK